MWAVAGKHRGKVEEVRLESMKTAWTTKGEGMVETLAECSGNERGLPQGILMLSRIETLGPFAGLGPPYSLTGSELVSV
jgi:hypothetical protein